MAAVGGGLGLIDLQTFVDITEHDINNTSLLLNDYVGPIEQLRIRTWEHAVSYAWKRFQRPFAEHINALRMCRPAIEVSIPRTAAQAFHATRMVPVLDAAWLE